MAPYHDFDISFFGIFDKFFQGVPFFIGIFFGAPAVFRFFPAVVSKVIFAMKFLSFVNHGLLEIPGGTVFAVCHQTHIVRPGLIHSVILPFGKSFGSGGGQTFGMISQFTRSFSVGPVMMILQGEAISPVIVQPLLSSAKYALR